MLYHLQDQQFAAVLEELFGFIEYRNQSHILMVLIVHGIGYFKLMLYAVIIHQGEDIGAVIHSIVHFCTPETII